MTYNDKWSSNVLDILLSDKTTGNNIIWATSDYENFPIQKHLVDVIKPRVHKKKEEQQRRTKAKAEVFTPSWVCNAQNNLVDNAWFDRENVFNIGKGNTWEATEGKIEFPNTKDRTWKDYVGDRRLEITCGEAPYLVSRYDAVTGESIELKNRTGLLDRKLRIVKENTNSQSEWLKWSERAFQSIYGFEFQGDNLFIARENLLLTYIDYMIDSLNREPMEQELINIAEIIAWNIWQMDGLKYTIPYQEEVYCGIKDWSCNEIVRFVDLLNKDN